MDFGQDVVILRLEEIRDFIGKLYIHSYSVSFTMDDETLTYLLKGGHLNMEELSSRGVWPHPPLRYDDVRDHLMKIIEKEEWFPCDLSSGREGVVIQNTGKNYICHSLQYSAYGPQFGSRKEKKSFRSAKKAADFYLKWDLHLPGDMDSWKVV